MNLNAVIRQLRRERGWSQERLAELCGVTIVSISRIETGKHGVSTYLLQSLAKTFGLEVHQLMALAEGALPYNTTSAPSSADEQQLLDHFRRLPADQQKLFLGLGAALVGKTRP